MHLTRTDPEMNLYRCYRLEIVKGLFGDWGLVREWGRIGSSGRLRTDWFVSEREAKDAHFTLHMKSGTDQSSPTSLNKLATNPVVCLNGKPNRTFRVRQA